MDIEKLISFFNIEYKDKEFLEFLKYYGVDLIKDIEIDAEIQYAFFCNYENGYDLMFDDEAVFKHTGGIGISGNYYFSCVHFYVQEVDGHNGYNGEIFNGIKMTDKIEEVRAKLKEDYKRHDFLDADIYIYKDLDIFIDYKKKNTPQIISISLVR